MSVVKLEYSKQTLKIGCFVSLLLGYILGFVVGDHDSPKYRKAKEQCEQSLPRSQHCIVEYVGKPVEEAN